MSVYTVWVQPIDDYTTPENVDKYGSVHDLYAEYADDEGGTPNKQFCDGQTSKTPPRYAQDRMIGIYTRTDEAAQLISETLRADVRQRILRGQLHLQRLPDWFVPTSSELYTMMDQYKSGVDFKVTAEDRPDLNAKARGRLQSEGWREYLKTEEGRAYLRIKAQYESVREAELFAADILKIQQVEAWQGNRRIANWVEGRLEAAGVEYKRIDALSDSIYFEIGDKKIRIADHIDVRRSSDSTRFLPSTHEVTPFTASWDAVVEAVLEELLKQ